MKAISPEDKNEILAICEKLFPGAQVASMERLGGLTNRSYRTALDTGRRYVVRLPGEGTSEMIDRADEKKSTTLAFELGIDAQLIYFDENTGVKVCAYVENCRTMDAASLRVERSVLEVADIFKKLHSCGVDTGVPFEVFEMAEGYEKFILKNGGGFYDDYADVKARVMALKSKVDEEHISAVPCHNDSLCENWLHDDARMYLIDWEYAGMNDPFWDLADISIEADYDAALDELLLRRYLGREATQAEKLRHTANKIYLDFLWSLWGKTRAPFDGEALEQYALDRYVRLKNNLAKANY